MTLIILRPFEDNEALWTTFPTPGGTMWGATDGTTAYEGGSGKPATASGIESKVSAQKAIVALGYEGARWQLPAGAKLISAAARIYCTPGKTKDLLLKLNFGGPLVEEKPAGTATSWVSLALEAVQLAFLQESFELGKEPKCVLEAKCEAALTTDDKVYQWQVEIEYTGAAASSAALVMMV
jgi:hypothetical protein